MNANLQITAALAITIVVAGLSSLTLGTRGGRFRALPGWAGFWVFFGVLLLLLSRFNLWWSFPVLAGVMLFSLRDYFFLAPVRPQDRRAILFAYLSVFASLYPVIIDSYGMFLTAILLYLFLVIPAILSLGSPHDGLLDSMGRVLLGMLVFVFCATHLAWMVHQPEGRPEFFGVLVLACEFPRRLAGRITWSRARGLAGLVFAFGSSAALGSWLGPWVGVETLQGLIVGVLVAFSVTAGGMVTQAIAQDLSIGSSSSRVGRAAMLDRLTPAIYAAPLYYHYLNHFA